MSVIAAMNTYLQLTAKFMAGINLVVSKMQVPTERNGFCHDRRKLCSS